MKSLWVIICIHLLCICGAIFVPVDSVVSLQEAIRARIAGCLVIAITGAVLISMRGRKSPKWLIMAVLALAGALSSTVAAIFASNACVADYEGRPKIVGFVLDPNASVDPGESKTDILLDAGGQPERAWRSWSIYLCDILVHWAAVAIFPFVALSVGFFQPTIPTRWSFPVKSNTPADAASAQVTPQPYIYDAFISYRHLEIDTAFALELLQRMEDAGFRVILDRRDFHPSQPVISEMERAVRQSRYVLCLITPNYLNSGYCEEEAVITATLSMNERRRRLVPLILQRTDLPAWLQGLVGLDFTDPAAPFDPFDRLLSMLRQPPN